MINLSRRAISSILMKDVYTLLATAILAHHMLQIDIYDHKTPPLF